MANISPEERQRRSDQMKRLHAEGRAGAAFGRLGGRPRKRRASELVADKVAEHAQELWNELYKLRQDRSSAVRLKAILAMLDIEERERSITVEEEKALEAMRRDELLEFVRAKLEALSEKGVLGDLILEGEAAEVVPLELEPGG